MSAVRWRSWLGASVVLFLLYGAVNVLAAVLVPATLISGGAGATAPVATLDADSYLAGGTQALAALRRDNPKLDTLLVSSMVGMCSQMMAFAIVALLVTWFVIRRGEAWGVWGVTAAALVQAPYYAVIGSMYAAQGAPIAGFIGFVPFYAFPLLAFGVGIVGLRRMQPAGGR